jgi:hypothetical protein
LKNKLKPKQTAVDRRLVRLDDFVDLSKWDITSPLSPYEKRILTGLQFGKKRLRAGMLERFVGPMRELYDKLPENNDSRKNWELGISLMISAMGRLRKSFWEWDDQDWAKALSQSRSQKKRKGEGTGRLVLLMAAMIAPGRFSSFTYDIMKKRRLRYVAKAIFGDAYMKLETEIVERIFSLGYTQNETHFTSWRHAIAHLVLSVGSCDIRAEDQPAFDRLCAPASNTQRIRYYAVIRALHAIGRFSHALPASFNVKVTKPRAPKSSWEPFITFWLENQTRSEQRPAKHTASQLRTIGRWFERNADKTKKLIATPVDLDAAALKAYARAVHVAVIGTFGVYTKNKGSVGDALRASSKISLLKGLRVLIEDLVDFEKLPESALLLLRHLLPAKTLQNQVRRDPRVLPDPVFAKLLDAAASLTPQDMPQTFYPGELSLAVAFTWLFAALRSDESIVLADFASSSVKRTTTAVSRCFWFRRTSLAKSSSSRLQPKWQLQSNRG